MKKYRVFSKIHGWLRTSHSHFAPCDCEVSELPQRWTIVSSPYLSVSSATSLYARVSTP